MSDYRISGTYKSRHAKLKYDVGISPIVAHSDATVCCSVYVFNIMLDYLSLISYLYQL